MAPKHPVPSGYGSPCEEGEFIPQGTSSGKVFFRYEEMEAHQDCYRNARDLGSGNMFDENEGA